MISHHQTLRQCSASFWFKVMYQLIRRGRENLQPHTKQSFAVRVDATGQNVYQKLDELDKNHWKNDDLFDSGDGRMYESTNNLKIIPRKGKLHPLPNLLWHRPKALDNFSESDGKNTLGSLMKTISVDYIVTISSVY